MTRALTIFLLILFCSWQLSLAGGGKSFENVVEFFAKVPVKVSTPFPNYSSLRWSNPMSKSAHSAYSAARQAEINSKVDTSRTINGKALTSNISLNSNDIGAEPALGNPSENAFCLKSYASGTRYFEACSSSEETQTTILDKIATPLETAVLTRQPGATSNSVPMLQIKDCSGVWVYQVDSSGCVTINSSPRFYSATSFTPFATTTTASRSTQIYARFAGPVLMPYSSAFKIYSTTSYAGALIKSTFQTTTSMTVTPSTTLSARHYYYVVLTNIYNACNSAISYTWSFRTGN